MARRTIEAGGQLILKEKPDRMFPGSQPFGDSARPSASIMYVPARKGAEVVGVLSIQSYTSGAYDRQSLEALQELADRCGGALDRLRSEEARRRSETKFRTLYDSTSDAVMLLNKQGFLDCNQAALAMFGCATREEFCSKHPADVSPPVQPGGTDSLTLANQRIATAMAKGSCHFEWMHKRADTGETFPAEVLLCALQLDGKRVLQGSVRDITERKAAETKLAELHKQLLDASRQAGMAEIATNVLHNVGNVLNSVNISTTLIVQSVKQSRASSLARVVLLLQEHAHDLGEFITNDSRGKHVPAHLAQLSEHLLAEQETNVRELASLRRNVEHIKEIVAMQQSYATFGGVKEMINVASVVEDSLHMTEEALRHHHVEVIREFEQVPPLNAEKHKLLQILVNLVRNAKHACQDSERADKQMTVRVANGAGRIRISVIDNGVGILLENLTRIFNHGFTTRKGGHGFGLHSGALAAKEMGGSLTVHSRGPGQGATFTLELPVLPSHETDSADSEPGKPNS
jgi:PAS domain S-box-containing protein